MIAGGSFLYPGKRCTGVGHERNEITVRLQPLFVGRTRPLVVGVCEVVGVPLTLLSHLAHLSDDPDGGLRSPSSTCAR